MILLMPLYCYCWELSKKSTIFFFLTKEDGVLEMEKKMCLLIKNSDYILLLPILNQVLMQTVTVTACLHYFFKSALYFDLVICETDKVISME